jgi:hypothetical protein
LTAFYNLKSSVALHFLAAFPAPIELESLTFAHFQAFCHQNRYFRYDSIPTMFANLQKPAPTLDEEIVPAYRLHTVFLANQLLLLTKQKKAAIKQVNQLFDQHPDAFIFASVPGAGELLAPKMLVMFGDHRQHYPHRSVLPAIAGTSPVTVASGKSRYVKFRRGCNRRYRHTAQQLAQMSTRKSVWAASYFDQVCSRGGSKSHAYRCLANRWLHIIWTLWQTRQVHDEEYHLRQVARHRRPLEKGDISLSIEIYFVRFSKVLIVRLVFGCCSLSNSYVNKSWLGFVRCPMPIGYFLLILGLDKACPRFHITRS